MIKKDSNTLDGFVTPKGLKFEFEKDNNKSSYALKNLVIK